MNEVAFSHALGQRLRLVREGLGMGQGELASACGVSDARYQEIEAGSYLPSIDELIAISDALDIDVSFFCEDILKPEIPGLMALLQRLLRAPARLLSLVEHLIEVMEEPDGEPHTEPQDTVSSE
ncbi:helix-turn-helix transcriptional regulator [Haliangium ochraceum]|uniref:Transcriptional regulator, XRE family n=1 Tax=Haliangium ochraceum (strain DSM 14365 / JCM 11303 / SMP-2) TaxID=502025 RepID=D0LP16_HALO1|nr:helix-turn-helix transcriptional regulator [Haliangium ochraceum]ACY18842.1 transcriptional regulator, XRE family [Haliangium ochraceum DSM 14365]